MVGVPVRIEVGKKDIDKGGVTVFRRDKRTKAFVKEKELVETLKSLLKDISENMRKNAAKYHASMINSAKNMDDVKKIIEAGKAAKVVWCGNIDCASKMEKSVDAPFVGKVVNEEASGKCVWCGKKGKFYGIVGKTY
jgi:prolyl-tRNA synthetase